MVADLYGQAAQNITTRADMKTLQTANERVCVVYWYLFSNLYTAVDAPAKTA
jgi:hypothetical protein